MSKSWQFSASRRALSQGVMWVILGLSLALAAVVDAHRRGAMSTKLERPQVYKGVTIAMPSGWDVTAGRSQDWGRVVQAKSSGDGEGDEDEQMAMLLARSI